MLSNIQQQIELLFKQRVVVLQPIPEQRKGLDRRPTTDDHLGAPARQQIDRGKVLKRSYRILGAEYGDGTRQPDARGANRSGAKDYGRRRIEELPAMVFSNAERIEPDRVRVLDLLDQVPHPRRRIDGAAVLIERSGEAVNPDLHPSSLRKRSSDLG
jgi:hypothetical protein